MKQQVIFIWSGDTYKGVITKQEPSSIQGMKTVIEVSEPFKSTFTIFGKCEVGNCGPYRVVSIKQRISNA